MCSKGSSTRYCVWKEAGAVGFEPTGVLPPLVFKTSAFVRSATPPKDFVLFPGIIRRSHRVSPFLYARDAMLPVNSRYRRGRSSERRCAERLCPLRGRTPMGRSGRALRVESCSVRDGFVGQIPCMTYGEQRQHTRTRLDGFSTTPELSRNKLPSCIPQATSE